MWEIHSTHSGSFFSFRRPEMRFYLLNNLLICLFWNWLYPVFSLLQSPTLCVLKSTIAPQIHRVNGLFRNICSAFRTFEPLLSQQLANRRVCDGESWSCQHQYMRLCARGWLNNTRAQGRGWALVRATQSPTTSESPSPVSISTSPLLSMTSRTAAIPSQLSFAYHHTETEIKHSYHEIIHFGKWTVKRETTRADN